jgi:hypothetical protein
VTAPTFNLPVASGIATEAGLEGQINALSQALETRRVLAAAAFRQPGITPENFSLDGGAAGDSTAGRVVLYSAPGRITPHYLVPLEVGRVYELRADYIRISNPSDPANDSVQAGVDWFDAGGVFISTTTTSTDSTLLVAAGLRRIRRVIARAAAEGVQTVAPAGARYARPFVRVYGTAHQTGVLTCALELIADLDRPDLPPYPEVANLVFVRPSPDGDDANNGRSFERAVATLSRALTVAGTLSGSKAIAVYPGQYATAGHLDMPDGTTLFGMMGARQTRIVPTSGNEEKNVLRLGDGCYVEGFSFQGWRVDSLTDPTEGFAISFRPGATISRVPYVHNIAVYRGGPPDLIPPPLDRVNGNPLVGRGAGCVLADAAVLNQNSVFPNIMAWGATPSTPNGIGYCAKNGAVINAINAISLWAHKHYLTLGGGRIILNGCSSQFGDYSVWSEGSCLSLAPPRSAGPLTVESAAAALVAANETAIINAMWADLVAEGLVTGWSAGLEALTRRDAGRYLLAVRYAFLSGQDQPIRDFARGLYTYAGLPVFDAAYVAAFERSFVTLGAEVIALGITTAATNMMNGLSAIMASVLDDPQFRTERSLIVALGHQITSPLAGVNKNALPSLQRRSGISRQLKRSVVQRDGGRVILDAQDDAGNRIFAGGMTLDARTGRLGGRPFDLSLQRIADDAAIAGSF